jgi:hypothetical protein
MVSLTAMPRTAAAELALEWTAPVDCPDYDDFSERVRRVLGELVKYNFTAATRVTHATHRYQARLVITSTAGIMHRELEHARCDVLADSVALVISLSTIPVEPGSDDSASVDLEVALHAAWFLGVLPRPSLGLGGALALEAWRSLRFELRGSYQLRQTATFPNSPVGARFDLASLGARGCQVWRLGRTELAPCLGAEFFRVAADGVGGRELRTQVAWWWAPHVGVLARYRIGDRFALALTVDALVPMTRQRFVFSELGTLHRASAIALRLAFAPEVRF